ncbi:tyrosine-protein phosphatase [Rossellomorea aquimaris]|uniref:Tyrosine-protein phosphatase n=1 Tax=Rossellomorea aquimaris TaxID=189382 RepID=A0A5D4TKH8_9BACI|nr:CpsB/CapC family capsule biosynthesis tyrosine phosphatase [Rossellomorea aquimaris]TYS76403.1 tyrosine protein phosphatase [Rossellomorea aquimaris]TYS82993.1 tyrosine protein phosphatase [Rossellomorea aquimaris]
MIDIHSHILPGVDDGARTMQDSVDMAKQAVSEGVHTIIATPHHMNGKYENEKVNILHRVDELNDHLRQEKIDLTVLPGQECRIYGEMVEDYHSGKLLPLNRVSPYIFVEFPSSSVPRYTDRLLYELQNEGLIPVIVHPERNAELIERPDKLYNLVKNGSATQLTASSLTGYFGKNIQKFSQQLIEANLTHFIASDAHNIHNRSFKMEEAMDTLEKKYGIDMIYYFTENAELLIEGKNIYKEIPEKIKKRKFLGIF